jgi:serine/threonine-protein kinase
MILDALSGLHAAHELCDESGRPLHIVHRDVSPHNVLVGSDGRAHITDFGIAHAEDRIQQTRTHEVKGKLAYLAPERVDKRRLCTVQSDVFAMAVVLWECFAGRRLFRGEDAVDVLQEVLNAVDEVLAKALSRDLATRYKTAHDFGEALTAAAGPDGIGSADDVARLVDAIFGKRMAVRQEQVRAVMGEEELNTLLVESGLPLRPHVVVSQFPTGEDLAQLAPPAPSGRYVLGTDLRTELRPGRPSLWVAGAVAFGTALGAAGTLAVVHRPAPLSARHASPLAVAPTSAQVPLERLEGGEPDLVVVEPPMAPLDSPAPHGAPAHEPVGQVHNGFTKLR